MTEGRRVGAAIAIAFAYSICLGVLTWLPRYDCVVLVPALYGVFALLAPVAERRRSLAIHAATQLLVLSFLVHLWTVGYEGRNAVFGGIVPWSDSHGFHEDALRLVHGLRFSEHASKRPIFNAFFAGLLAISGGSLRFALVVCAVAGAWATAAASLAVWKTHGHKSALVVYLLLLFFERRWTGFVQTEHAGIALGALGFVLIWRAAACSDADRKHARTIALAGLVASTLGMMARAGTFFVLPALVVWIVRTFADERRERLRLIGWSLGAVAIGVFTHRALLAVAGAGVTFSDYPGIFYGMIHGEDYTYLVGRYPELATLSTDARSREAIRIIVREVSASPMLLVVGMAKSAAGLFVSPFGMFSYIWTNPDDHVLESAEAVRQSMATHGIVGPLVLWQKTLGLFSLVNAGVMGALGASYVIATLVAVVRLFRHRQDRYADCASSLLRYTFVGVLASAPFLPPWITSGQQVQTVTMAFVAALTGVVVFGKRSTSAEAPKADSLGADPLVAAPFAFIGIVALLVAGMKLAPASLPSCARDSRVVYPYDGTAFEVAARREVSFRTKGLEDLRASLGFLAKHNPELPASFGPYLREGTLLVMAFDACDQDLKIVVDDAHRLNTKGGWQSIEATTLASPKVIHVDADPSPQAPVEP